MHRPRRRLVLALLILLALASTACGPSAQEVVGVVVDVQAVSLLEVRSLTIETPARERLVFTTRGDIGFTASHLREHMVAGDPLKVTYIKEGEELRALRVEDAP